VSGPINKVKKASLSFQGKPRILYVVSHCPTAKTYGAQLRTLYIGRMLKDIGNLTLVICSVREWEPEEIAATAKEFKLAAYFRMRNAPFSGLVDRLKHEFDPHFMNTHGFIIRPQDHEKFREISQNFDLLWVQTLRVANAFRIWQWPSSVIDLDDVLSQYFKSEIKWRSGWQRLRAIRNFVIWVRRERKILERFSTIIVCSEEDKAWLGGSNRIKVIPNSYFMKDSQGIDFEDRTTESEAVRLGFIGKINYPPNREGLEWFLREVWPIIRLRIPNCEFRVVGEGRIELNKLLLEGVHFLGWLADPTFYPV
jgi:hypothetical protein